MPEQKNYYEIPYSEFEALKHGDRVHITEGNWFRVDYVRPEEAKVVLEGNLVVDYEFIDELDGT
jgi:hypothetical protein